MLELSARTTWAQIVPTRAFLTILEAAQYFMVRTQNSLATRNLHGDHGVIVLFAPEGARKHIFELPVMAA
jgi:hypothetical protein